MGHEVGAKTPPPPQRVTNRCRAQLGRGGVGWGNFCHFCQYFAHCFDQVLKGIVFFFLFQIEEEVPSTELSCYGFKTQGMNFYVPSDFWFSLIAKNMSSCC